MENENNEVVTLGSRLRKLTGVAKVNIEISNFSKVLEEAAKSGNSAVSFPDLRDYLPTMIMNNTVWDWLKEQEIIAQGSINNNTGAYVYTISWE